MYNEVITNLRQAYDLKAEERDQMELSSWKIEERDHFLSHLQYEGLQEEGKKDLLEIGAGTGMMSKFFQDSGLNVICTDLSLENVKLCQAKGLTAYVMDFLHLDFPNGSFDAIYALNCLLHVPKRDLPRVLKVIRALLKPRGLFYMGLHGGREHEGTWEDDEYEPKRFYANYSDEQIRRIVTKHFDLLYFKTIPTGSDTDLHFQSMILRRPEQ